MSYQQCSKCVLDTAGGVKLELDAAGICQYCRLWPKLEQERKTEATNLPWRLDRIRKDGRWRRYDALLGLSGGVDSSYALHFLHQHGLRILAWSFDNKFNVPAADENIFKIVEKLKVPFLKEVLNLEVFNELYTSFLRAGLKNIEAPYDMALFALQYRLAKQYGIKWIINGGNFATESTCPPELGHDAKDLRLLRSVYRRFAGRPLRDYPTLSLPGYIWNRFVRGVKVFQPLNYIDYDRKKAEQELADVYGFTSTGEKHMENYLTRHHILFYLKEKFGLDKRRAHFSSLILSGQMTRSEAMKALLNPPEYPIMGIEKKVMEYPIPNGDFMAFPNSARAWAALQRLYAFLKKRQNV